MSQRHTLPETASIANLDPDIDNHDIVYGVSLPKLGETLDGILSHKKDVTVAEAESIDLTGLRMHMNHNDDMHPVGCAIAYKVQRPTNDASGPTHPEAEMVFKMNREPDQPGATDPLTEISLLQRNYLMTGAHKSLSTGHDVTSVTGAYNTDGRVNASASGRAAVTFFKNFTEVSTCEKGLRPGSDIKGYYPCARTLRRSVPSVVRAFASHYGYREPPPDHTHGTRVWDKYLGDLLVDVRRRRHNDLNKAGFIPMLHSRGFVAASGDKNQNSSKKSIDQDQSALVCPDDFYLTVKVNASASASDEQATVRLRFPESPREAKCTAILSNSQFVRTQQTFSSMSSAGNGSLSAAGATSAGNGAQSSSNESSSNQNQNQGQAPPLSGAQPTGAQQNTPAAAPKTMSSSTAYPPIIPADGKPIDPHEAALQAAAMARYEREEKMKAEAELAEFRREKAAREQQEASARAAAEEQKRTAEKQNHNARQAKMTAILGAALEQMMSAAGGNVSAEEINETKKDYTEEINKASSGADLDRVEKLLGRLTSVAVKASAGAHAANERAKQRELAQVMQSLSSELGQPPRSNLAVSGGSALGFMPTGNFGIEAPQMPPTQTPVNEGTFKHSANIFSSAFGGAAPIGTRPAFGNTMSSSTFVPPTAQTQQPSQQQQQQQPQQKQGPPTVDLDAPGWAGSLLEEYQYFKGAEIPGLNYIKSGGVALVETFKHSANGQIERVVQAKPRRPVGAFGKRRITMEDVAPEQFKELVDGIRLYTTTGHMPSLRDIGGMAVPDDDWRKCNLVKYVPQPGDKGVTIFDDSGY